MAGLIAHEWIAPHGGSENVAEAMGRVFPDADVVTLWNDAPGRFSGHRIRETWLARSPIRKSKALALPFMSGAWRRARLDGYDFVLVSSHVFAHHIGGSRRSAPYPRSFVYVHTPARTIWAPEQDTRGANPLVKFLAPAFRWLDLRAVRSDTAYAANSRYIQQRIADAWGQESTVIYPPVDVSTIRAACEQLTLEETELISGLPMEFVLGASRFVPYKRLDLVIEAAATAGRPVVLAGSGPMRGELEARAAELDVTVTFVHRPSDALLHELYRRAAVFVFPAVEDFGIMPVEAMAAGTPVVVYREGGASESVELVDGGVIVDSLDGQALAEAVRRASSKDMTTVPERVEAEFGEATFRARLLAWMGSTDSGAPA